MPRLEDFFHLPQLDTLVEQIVTDGPGLIVVAGLDPRPLTLSTGQLDFLPSGRPTTFRILLREILTAQSTARAIVVAECKGTVRVPSQLRQRVE